MKYYVRTQTTVKERDRGKWWMDSDMICPKTIEADNLPQLLELYREAVSDIVSISDNALKIRMPCMLTCQMASTNRLAML